MADELKGMEVIMDKVGAMIKEKAIRAAPNDLGDMRRHIGYRIEGNNLIIFCNTEHAKDMEYGKPPEPLSPQEKDEIDAWAKRHGLKNGKGTARHIEKAGIKVGTIDQPLHITSLGRNSYRPFFRPALYQVLNQINRII